MRIVLISDIHSNWPALQAVRESGDLCLFLGDLVDYGGEPGPCVDWARQNVTYAILDEHRVEFRRIDYAVEDAIRSVEDSPLPEKAKAMLAAVYRTGALPKNGQ